MRNLVLTAFENGKLPFSTGFSICNGGPSGNLYLLSTDGILVALQHKDFVQKLDLSTAGFAASDWFLTKYLVDSNSIVCFAHSGQIVSVDADTFTAQDEGRFEEGIQTAQWSPDQSRVVVVTEAGSLVLLSSLFDPMQEIPLPRTAHSQALISWRGDGELFSLYFSSSDTELQVEPAVHIYSNTLEIIAVAKNIAQGDEESRIKGLLPALACAPNGSLIAVTQRLPRRMVQVSFLEMNGLRHGELEIVCPVPNEDAWTVSGLGWDLSSSILAVQLQSPEGEVCVQLYVRGNYHWYLKQELHGLELVQFDSEVAGRLYCRHHHHQSAQEPSFLSTVDMVWDVCTSSTAECTAAAIDGLRVLLTPLHVSCVPPPMSKYQLSLRAPCNCVSSFTRSDGATSGVACITSRSEVAVYFCDAVGEPSLFALLDLGAREELGLAGGRVHFRGVLAVERSDRGLYVLLLGSGLRDGYAPSDWLLLLSTSDAGVLVSWSWRAISGSAGRLCAIPSSGRLEEAGQTFTGVGITEHSAFGVFGVYKVNLSGFAGEDAVVRAASFPESCGHIAYIGEDADDESSIIVGMSSKNRLYCGDALIYSGVSSFAFNAGLRVLLYVTVGTKPQLNFVPADQLSQDRLLDMHRDGAAQDYNARPLERGSRLVASVHGSSKVVVQLPRGNLEGFEPRPLLLQEAMRLLDGDRVFECLVLIKRQRLDFNLALDYKYSVFTDNIASVVQRSLEESPELLSLLVAALESSNVTLRKYGDIVPPSAFSAAEFYANKSNLVCAALRQELLIQLRAGRPAAVNPILCTYAKESPPQLTEALRLIRSVYACESEAALNGTKAQAALRYLSFLVEHDRLFTAALGECDFAMCRAIGRQSQMDPKQYLPLLQRFEALLIGGAAEETNPAYCYMRMTVYHHLQAHELALSWGIKVINTLSDATQAETELPDTILSDVAAVLQQVSTASKALAEASISQLSLCLDALKAEVGRLQRLHRTQAPQLAAQDPQQGALALSADRKQLIADTFMQLLYELKEAYGDRCVAMQLFRDAAAAYLTMAPRQAEKAVRAARLEGHWQHTLLLAKHLETGLPPELHASRLAGELMREYRGALEQSQSTDIDDLDMPATLSSSQHQGEATAGGRALEASQICLDYCGDPEAAISVLLLSRNWKHAVSVALKTNRPDILKEEIAVSIRASAETLAAGLSARITRFPQLVAQLSALWRDPEERLRLVAESDSALLRELTAGPLEEGDADAGESRSEFSAAGSSYSRASQASAASARSGTSTASMLSQLMAESSLSAVTTSSAFSVEGLDHSLLSRGKEGQHRGSRQTAKTNAYHEKREKKKERKRGRGSGRDTLGLLGEQEACDELLALASVAAVALHIQALCEVLLLLGTPADLSLAKTVQSTMDEYLGVISSAPPCSAPAYPKLWLEQRHMHSVLYFRDNFAEAQDKQTWWKRVAEGIQVWRGVRRASYF